ncbi:MAG TPA: LysR family transcriptional regulator [Candidatus Acidoferrales bacterium]|nr:LysR family transcriptional regulator [Candidatus Acidoferrales bacterium]
MDQLSAVRVFVRVADRGSFTQAADDLNLSRSVVSGQVAALEQHLGVRLLNRTTRRVGLTADGSEYVVRCRRILEELEAAEESLRRGSETPTGPLRVDVPVAFGRNLLVPALGEFTQRYPGVQLDVRLNDRVADLVTEQVDVAVRAGVVQQRQLVARRIVVTRFLTCAAPEYLAANGVPKDPDDLRRHRCIGLANPQTGRVAEWSFRRGRVHKKLRLDFALTINSVEAVVTAAVEGLGIVRSIDLLVAQHLASGRLRVVLPEWSDEGVPLSIVYPSAGHRSVKVRAFADFAARLLQDSSRRAAESLASG